MGWAAPARLASRLLLPADPLRGDLGDFMPLPGLNAAGDWLLLLLAVTSTSTRAPRFGFVLTHLSEASGSAVCHLQQRRMPMFLKFVPPAFREICHVPVCLCRLQQKKNGLFLQVCATCI